MFPGRSEHTEHDQQEGTDDHRREQDEHHHSAVHFGLRSR
jgi:hypothetical protein